MLSPVSRRGDGVPPQNKEAEESVIGAMMISPNAIEAVADILEPDGQSKFYFSESLGRIYRCALDLTAQDRSVDAITLTDELELRGQLEGIGGRVRLHELAALVPASANVHHYAKIVRENWVLREIIVAGGKISELGWERPDEADVLLAQVEEIATDIRTHLERVREQSMTMYEAAEYLDGKFKNPPEEGFGIPTPWSFMPSFHGGRLYVLGGYQADGKTVQGAHFFRHAVAAGVPTDFWTLEMSMQDLVERLAANMGLPAKRVQSGRLMDEQRPVAAKIIGDMARWGDTGHIFDAPAADVATIRRRVKLNRPKFVIIDHLHQFGTRAEYERQDLEAIVRGLWQIAREYDVAILLLAQLSRSGDKKNPYPRPTMANLRGSGMIEALAWCVFFVWRTRNEQNIATSTAEWIVAKNRSGPTGIRDLTFHDRETRFTEVVREG